jgi:hypothetical protein
MSELKIRQILNANSKTAMPDQAIELTIALELSALLVCLPHTIA